MSSTEKSSYLHLIETLTKLCVWACRFVEYETLRVSIHHNYVVILSAVTHATRFHYTHYSCLTFCISLECLMKFECCVCRYHLAWCEWCKHAGSAIQLGLVKRYESKWRSVITLNFLEYVYPNGKVWESVSIHIGKLQENVWVQMGNLIKSVKIDRPK